MPGEVINLVAGDPSHSPGGMGGQDPARLSHGETEALARTRPKEPAVSQIMEWLEPGG